MNYVKYLLYGNLGKLIYLVVFLSLILIRVEQLFCLYLLLAVSAVLVILVVFSNNRNTDIRLNISEGYNLLEEDINALQFLNKLCKDEILAWPIEFEFDNPSIESLEHTLDCWFGDRRWSSSGDMFILFGKDGTGSLFLLWQYPGLNNRPPVVFLGSEGDSYLIASDTTEFVKQLGSGLLFFEGSWLEPDPDECIELDWKRLNNEIQKKYGSFEITANETTKCARSRQPDFTKWVKGKINKSAETSLPRVKIGLFHAPLDDIGICDIDTPQTCYFCSEIKLSFDLEFAHVHNIERAETNGKFGCFRCLMENKFQFQHMTELGCLKSESQTTPDIASIEEDSRLLLLNTPTYSTWQDERWLSHCNEFMTFIGEWHPPDFENHAQSISPRELFMQMTIGFDQSLWDDVVTNETDIPDDWYATFYAFQCSKCNKLRGHWDFT